MILLAMALNAATEPARGQQPLAREGHELVTPLGSRLPRWEEKPLPAEQNGALVLRRFAACVAKTQEDKAAQLIATFPNSTEEASAIQAIVGTYSACLSGASTMRLQYSLFRGAIVEALYKARLPTSEPLNQQPMMDYQAFYQRLRTADRGGPDITPRAGMYAIWWMSYCTAHEDPVAVDRLIRSESDSANELDALRALRPVLARCLFKNQIANFNRITLRSALATALYWLRFRIGEGMASRSSKAVGGVGTMSLVKKEHRS